LPLTKIMAKYGLTTHYLNKIRKKYSDKILNPMRRK